MTGHRRVLTLSIVLAASLLAPFVGWAQTSQRQPSATASLSSAQTTVGDRVRLSIEIAGSKLSDQVPTITVDGLEIRFLGHQTRMESVNFVTTVSTILNYVITAEKAGEFEIPAQSFLVDGVRVTTQPLKITVGDAPAGSQGGSGAAAGSGGEAASMFSQIQIPEREEFYVGEAIPFTVRFFVGDGIQATVEDSQRPPPITSPDFTIPPASEPARAETVRDGRTYGGLAYSTILNPVKSGDLVIPSIELPVIVTSRERRSRGPLGRDFDPFNPSSADRIFEEMFSNDPLLGGAVRRRVVLRSDPKTIVVRELPKEGRPADFNGAIGQFQMETSASPAAVAPGDPITIKTKISGAGNFAAVTGPQIKAGSGWMVYPPTSKFTPSDTSEEVGVKEFETLVVPDRTATGVPTVSFTFFDPKTKSYQMLTAPPLNITVAGATPQQPAATVGPSDPQQDPGPSASDPTPTPDTAISAGPRGEDILHIQPNPGRGGKLLPPWKRNDFWFVQGGIALVLLLLAIGPWMQVSLMGEQARARRDAAKQTAHHWDVLRDPAAARPAFYAAALGLLKSNALPRADLAEAGPLIQAAHDRAVYAGESTPLSLEERSEVLRLLKIES